MKQVYPVFIVRDGEDFLVNVPDMEILTEGTSFADAIEMARDAIGAAGISMEDHDEKIPEPSSREHAFELAGADTDIVDFTQGIMTYVDVDFSEYRRKVNTKTVRRNVALPGWLDYEAEKAGINVSRVLQDALMAKLNVSRM